MQYIISLYERVIHGDDSKLCEKAKELLAQLYISCKEYEKVESFVAQMSQEKNAKQLRVKQHLAQKQYKQARNLQEESVLNTSNELYQMLMLLLDIAIKEERWKEGKYIANVTSKYANILDLWEYNEHVPLFEYAIKHKQKKQSMKATFSMLRAAGKPWKVNASPLYGSIPSKPSSLNFFTEMKNKLIQSIKESPETDFLKEEPEFLANLDELYQGDAEKSSYE